VDKFLACKKLYIFVSVWQNGCLEWCRNRSTESIWPMCPIHKVTFTIEIKGTAFTKADVTYLTSPV